MSRRNSWAGQTSCALPPHPGSIAAALRKRPGNRYHLRQNFIREPGINFGIADQLRPKMTNIRGAPVGAGVARGEVEIGIHQIAELLPIAGIDIVGDLPTDLNKTIVYATGLAIMVKHADAANALVKYLALPSSVPVI
jgi:hypothetical protein